MNRKWLLLPLAIAVAVLIHEIGLFSPNAPPRSIFGFGAAPAPAPAKTTQKPVCDSSVVNPNVAPPTDCIPQYIANLPPDPGPAGMKTLEGIDADKDGVRDDVQRFIVIEYGHSQRGVAALMALAKNALMQVKVGDSVSGDEAYALVKDNHAASCYARSVGKDLQEGGAREALEKQVINTQERTDRFWKFQQRVAHQGQGFLMPDLEEPLEKLCGYDPAKLAN